jgi:hypothetical protein
VSKRSKVDAAASGKVEKTKSAVRSTSAKAKKSTARKKNLVQAAKEAELAPVVFDPTEEQIQTRAYFISERRRRFDLPGDAHSDWLEAKRQLLSETRH